MSAMKVALARTNSPERARLRQRLLGGLGRAPSDPIPVPTPELDLMLLAALPAAVYTADCSGRITFMNKAAASLWGGAPLVGATPWPFDADREPGDQERIIERPDGSRSTVLHSTTLLRDVGGSVTGTINLLVDLTEAKAAEAAQRECEEHGRSAIELSSQMQWTADPQGCVLDVGDRWCAFVGQTREEALEGSWLSVANNNADQARVSAAIRDSLGSGEPYDIRYRARTATGAERWVRLRAHARRDGSGAIVRWYGSTEDIHDSVLVEEESLAIGNRHRLVAEAADDISWDMDLVRDSVTWGPALERRLDVWPDGGKSNRAWWLERIHPDDRSRVLKSIAASVSGTSSHHSCEYRFRRADGSHAHVLDRGTMIRDDAGNVVRAVGAMLDRSEQKSAEEALRLSEKRLLAAETASSMASDAAEHIAWDLDVERDIVTWSAPLQRRFGHSPAPSESNRAWWRGQIHPEDRARINALLETTMAGSATRLRAEYRFRRADGSYAHVLDRGSLIRNDEGRVVRAIGAMIDLSERRKSEEALRLSEERFRLAANAAGLGIADVDVVADHDHWSPELRAMLGIADDVPAGLDTYIALIHPEDRAIAAAQHDDFVRGGTNEVNVHRIIRPSDGGVRWIAAQGHAMKDDEGRVVRIIVTNKDITDEKTLQDRITWAAAHDAVTGLPNRSAFQSRLEETLAHAVLETEPVGLLLIDLDNFKAVNDSLGHQAGDRALIAFAGRIGEAMPANAIVVRFGGDEFAVILPAADAAAACAIAGGLVLALQSPSSIGDRNIDLRCSIGVAAFPDHGGNANELVQNADLALYAAKEGGGAMARAFEPALRTRLQDQLSMLAQARAALDHGWIQPFYQPKIALATGAVEGFEALLRWRDPALGIALPSTIACAFDDTELAALIGEAMIGAVLADMRAWLDRGIAFGKIAINASAAEFREPGFAERLLVRMAGFDVPPTLLELEITETAFLGDSAANVVAALKTLGAAGMTIALDDFGTGFSSLSHLRNLPVDTIKIDRSFVAGLGESAEDRAIIEAVLRLGDALGMTTVAEGVETQAQADYLRAHGCTLAQGFLFAPAIAADEVPDALIALATGNGTEPA